ncbi:unnamed protein product [Amoebophrya sp. A25]|nr:unnamed protein product [Amoebophrya sp. A25]|eukprot:GSA25T00006727001.1
MAKRHWRAILLFGSTATPVLSDSKSTKNLKCEGTEKEVADCGNVACDSCYPQDCEWESWSSFGACTCEGLMERHRSIAASNNECGKPCEGPKVETRACSPDCVKDPIDCRLSEWGSWSTCDKECDGGQTSRTREIVKEPAYGGKPCEGGLSETKACNMQKCHTTADCVLADWGSWGECSKSCDGGQQERTRSIESAAKFGGEPCRDPLVEMRGCNEQVCQQPVDCVWGDWNSWSACSKSCNGGEKTRSRQISVAPLAGGQLCTAKEMSEVAACNEEPCDTPVDCALSEWSSWDDCSCSCNGIHARVRFIETYPAKGGMPCNGSLKQVQACNVESCLPPTTTAAPPIDCKLGDWGDWATCSATCGGGEQTRSRLVVQQAKYGGAICHGDLKEIRGCNAAVCELPKKEVTRKNCEWSNWDTWGACSVSCGGGQMVRERQVMKMPNEYGEPCTHPDGHKTSMELKECNTQPCLAVNCKWGEWSAWGACTCTGLSERHRSIAVHQEGEGKLCTGSKIETQVCEPDCTKEPADCVLSEWDDWSQCTSACGGGQTYRTRGILKEAKNGGKTCENDIMKETRPCNTEVCSVPIDCEAAEWSSWSSCTASCDGGVQTRKRKIIQHAAAGGNPCDFPLEQVEPCGTAPCKDPIDCVWGEWAPWSDCSVSCDGGQKTRDRNIAISPRNGGKLCEARAKSEVAPCSTQHCGVGCIDGEWEPFSEWSPCSASCGQGYTFRSRAIAIAPNHCGRELEGLAQEYKKCNEQECSSEAVDCMFSEWTSYGDCDAECNGVKDRTRMITTTASGGGKACSGSTKEITSCNVPGDGYSEWGEACKHPPADCVLSEWSYWSDCSSECEGGTQVRTREITTQPSGNGKACEGSLSQVQGCNQFKCADAVDCLWGEWQSWGACSVQCGSGERSRFRHISTMPKNGGNPCDSKTSVEVEACNEQPCGELQYCAWEEWSPFSECTTTCGPGQKIRSRKLSLTTSPYNSEDVLVTGLLSQLFGSSSGSLMSATSSKLDSTLLAFFSGMAMSVAILALAYAGVRRSSLRGGALGTTGEGIEMFTPVEGHEPFIE